MNPAMFFVAALALCALPSALGLMCYKCQGNETSLVLCDTMSQFTTENCTGENNTCSRTAIMNPQLTAMNKVAYQLACVKSPNTCVVQNTTVCAAAISGATAKNLNITSCMTTCCNDKDNCNKPPMPMPPITTTTTTPEGPKVNATVKPTSAGDMFRPIGSLFIVLPAFYFGIQ